MPLILSIPRENHKSKLSPAEVDLLSYNTSIAPIVQWIEYEFPELRM